MSTVRIITGPPRSGKTRAVLAEALPWIRENRSRELLILVPSNLKAEEIREDLLSREGLPGYLGLCIYTFLDLTQACFQASPRPGRMNPPPARRWMIQTLLAGLRLPDLQEVKGTRGFTALTADLIRTLKEGAVTPEELHRNVLTSGGPPKLLEMCALYRTYEERRTKGNLLDREDLFDLAAQEMDQAAASAFAGLHRVTVTGFYDYTPLQLRLLASLARLPGMEAVTLTLHQASGPGPAERFLRRTLERLLVVFPGAEITSVPPEEKGRNDPLLPICRHFFSPPEETPVLPAGTAVRIVEAPGTYQEVEEIARTIRSLMEEQGYDFRDFALVFRTLSDYRDVVEEIFRFFGIAHRMTSGLPLARNPLVQAVLGILEVPRSGYRREAVVQLLRSHYLRFEPLARSPVSAERIDVLAREAMIHGGKEEWKTRMHARVRLLNDRLQRLESGLLESGEVQKVQDKIHDLASKKRDYRACGDVTDALFAALTVLPQSGHLARFVESLEKIMDSLHVEEGIYTSREPRLVRRDQAALRTFQDLLHRMVEDQESIQSGRELSLTEFLRILSIALDDTTYSPDPPGEDAVLVSDVLGIRDLHRPVVFLGGLHEGSFPRTHGPNPLFGETERMRLNAALAPRRWIPLAEHWREEEEVLFVLSAAAATDILFLTCSRTDGAGRDLLRSRYMDRVLALFEEGSVSARIVPLRDPLPEKERIFRNKELLEYTFRSLHRPLAREPQAGALFHEMLRSQGKEAAGILHGLRVQRARERGDGPYMGGLGADAAALLRRQENPYSATALENYGMCPFKYFCEHVLRLRPVEEVEDEMGAPDMGGLYHKILERFYREAGGPVTRGNLGERRVLLHGIIEMELAKMEYQGVPGHKKIWEIRRAEVHQVLDRFLEQEAEAFETSGEVPTHFEACFGMPPSPVSDPLSTERPLVLPSDSGPIRLTGKVDRIDTGEEEGEAFFSILDYKSGKYAAGTTAVWKGESLQLPVYAEWARQSLAHPGRLRRGCFYLLKKGERRCQIPAKNASWEDLWEITRKHIEKYVESIRNGKFPVTEKKCPDYCRLTHVCRIGERR